MNLQKAIAKAASTRSCDQSDYIYTLCELLTNDTLEEAQEYYIEHFIVPAGAKQARLLLLPDEYEQLKTLEAYRPEIIMEVFLF